jgi:catechol 2,3-dioxygenase-like lactoylglutathione lyase family enzyme
MTTKVHILSGVESARPFQIRRLGHFGVNVESPEKSLHFYRDLLGFKVSDQIDFADRLPPELKNQIGPTVGFFTRHGTDHHSFVLFPKKAVEKVNPQYARFPQLTANQLTWQVGSLQEIVDAFSWFTDQAIPIIRSGRDLPGSNWHFYPTDPAGHINELYYGIEQIGWSGHSKALAMHDIKFQQPPNLPYHSEYAEVNRAIAHQIHIHAGWRDQSNIAETYPVDGILLARPFKIIKIGPVRLFVDDLSAAKDFYTRIMGLRLTEEIKYQGYSCYFLSSNTEHHALAIYPTALRTILGLNPSSTTFAFAMQVASYQQLRTMYHYLKDAGITIQPIPHELSPGLGHHFYAIDPDGYLVQFYWEIEQIGWDGNPRPAGLRRTFELNPSTWPTTIESQSDSFMGEVFLGPLN